MTILLTGPDYGVVALGRQLWLADATTSLTLVHTPTQPLPTSSHRPSQQLLFPALLAHAVSLLTTGRIAIAAGRPSLPDFSLDEALKDKLATQWQKQQLRLTKRQKRRQRFTPKLTVTPQALPALDTLADEGLADSVEFRRLARRYLRPLRHAHCQLVVFPQAIMATEAPRRLLQHIAGTQLQVVTLADLPPSTLLDHLPQLPTSPDTPRCRVFSADQPHFVRQRCQTILRTQLAQGAVQPLTALPSLALA